jgi:hypothetical protein
MDIPYDQPIIFSNNWRTRKKKPPDKIVELLLKPVSVKELNILKREQNLRKLFSKVCFKEYEKLDVF